jgi:hypothetical protein
VLPKRGTTLEYCRASSERAQIVFKQTVKQANARLNFEQFLYALKLLALDVYPLELREDAHEVTMQDAVMHEHKAFFTLIWQNIIKNRPKTEIGEEDQHEVAEALIKDMLDAMQDDDVAELVKLFGTQIAPLASLFQSTLSGLFDFEATLKFCQTYDIFPSLASKARLKDLFSIFASFHEQSSVNKVGKRTGAGEEGRRYIDMDLLGELLTTVAIS